MIYKLLLLLIFSNVFSTPHISLNKHITSKLNTKEINVINESLLVATSGGIYSIFNDSIDNIELFDAVNLTDISDVDNNNNLWLASRDNAVVQILNQDFDLEYVLSYPSDINLIDDVTHTTNGTFAIGCKGECLGSYNDQYFIMKYYNYYYDNIIENLNTNYDIINDINLIDDKIYIATNNGLFNGDINENLLIPENWSLNYIGNNILHVNDDIALTSNAFIDLNNEQVIAYNPLDIDGAIVGLFNFFNDDTFQLLTETNLYSINSNYEITNMVNEIPGEIVNPFTAVYHYNDKFYFGIKNNGVATYDINNSYWNYFLPNTIFQNKFDAIDVNEDNLLIGISKSGGFIMEDAISSQNIIMNFYPYAFSDTSLYTAKFPTSISNFNAYVFPYWSGGKKQPSIIMANNNVFFSNSGSYPFIPDNINYHYNPIMNLYTSLSSLPDFSYYGSLGFFSLSDSHLSLTMKSNGIIGGLGGFLDANETSGYMNISQIRKDRNQNVWVVNPYCENYFENNNRVNRPISFKLFNSDEWKHIYDYQSEEHFIPTEIAFSDYNRIWVGYRFYENDQFVYSKGGIRMIEYNDINNINDDIWYDLNMNEYANVNVWSLEVSKDLEGNEVLWVLSDLGLKGYYFNIIKTNSNNTIISMNPLSEEYYFSNLTFREGCKIKVDSGYNIWVITNNDGVKIVQRNGTIFNDTINRYSYNILSDNVSDITFNDKGLVYLATDLGISVLNTSFSSSYNPSAVSVSPNPFMVGDDSQIIFSNVAADSRIKLMTLSGLVLKEFKIDYNGQKVYWDGKGSNGTNIPTGVYLLASSNPMQNTGVTKLAIIRK